MMLYSIEELEAAAEKAGEKLEYRYNRSVITEAMCKYLPNRLGPYYEDVEDKNPERTNSDDYNSGDISNMSNKTMERIEG